MKAIALTGYTAVGDTAAFEEIELPLPVPGTYDLRVRIEAISLDHMKLHAASPESFTEPKVLGYAAAGVVDAIGIAAQGFLPGDRVYYAGEILRPGSNAHYALVDARLVAKIPDTLNFIQAAALPLSALTAWELLFERMPFDCDAGGRGKSLLVIGGAGGVGSIAIQLAHRAGFTVIATASRQESADWCHNLSAHHVINHRDALAPQLEALGLSQIDVVLNLADTTRYWDALGQLLAPQGHLGLIVAPTKPLPIGDPYKAKCISIHWEWMFARPRFQTQDLAKQGDILSRVANLVAAGDIKSIVGNTLSPINAANLIAAHRMIDSGTTIGKIVLSGW